MTDTHCSIIKKHQNWKHKQ